MLATISSQALSPAAAGYFNPVHVPGLAVIGTAALAWLAGNSISPTQLARRGLRAGILAGGARAPAALRAWPRAGIAVLRSRMPAHELVHALRRAAALAEAPRRTVHGVLLEVFGLGVLLQGPPGIGKSELALELLSRGHRLIADDVVELLRPAPQLLLGESPPLLRGHLEVRGLGIVNLRRLFGAGAVVPRQRVDLVVELRRSGAGTERLGARRQARRFLGVAVSVVSLPAGLGHNSAVLIETACRDHWLRLHGENSAAAFVRRQQRALRQQPVQE